VGQALSLRRPLQAAPGVQIAKLSEADVEPYLARYASYQNNAFVALNTANFEDGLFIHIAKGAVIEEPIELIIQSSANGHPTVSHPRILIVAEPDSQATIIETYTGNGGAYFTNPSPKS
jgi:Fe-S cluster assembly protein SufD